MSSVGSYKTTKKDGTLSFRASITYRNKHISLGSFSTEALATKAYEYAGKLLYSQKSIADYKKSCPLSFDKYVILVNFRDNKVYFKNPIYLQKRYFLYYLSRDMVYTFDIEDLFYYAEHKISKRGGHLFVADYGMQVNINSRYGIKRHAVLNRDYRFINDDIYDYRYENIEIINKYHGVLKQTDNEYKAVILINGNYNIGTYPTEQEAAIAYNKAVDTVKKKYPDKNYELNYIESLTPSGYAEIYTRIKISDKLYNL